MTSVTDLQKTPRLTKLDGLMGHLSASSGLFSKETFLSLYSCITRMIRDHGLEGLVMTRTLDDDDFEPMATALCHRPSLSLFRYDEPQSLPESTGLANQTGFLIALTNRLTVVLYWNVDSRRSFQMYRGGWTFNPNDCKTIATHFINHLETDGQDKTLSTLLEETPIDRRYDEKLNIMIGALVGGLENQNRELAVALQKVQDLNKQVVQHERLAAVGQLCSVIAHEIRNPLGLIDLYAKLIETQASQFELAEGQDEKRGAMEKNITLIRQSIESLESILSELTSYSRPLTLKLEKTDIGELVSDLCDFYRPKYDEKSVALALNVNIAGIELTVDRGRVRQALINLLKNALEISKENTQVTINVDSRKNDDKVYIKVRDEGPGIDERARQKLFTPYFSTKKNGTGLGLAHSRKILQTHGGSVELMSTTVGEGSTFALILPKDPGVALQNASSSSS